MRPSPGDAPASRFPGDIRTSPHGLKQEYTPDHKDSGFPGSSVKTALPDRIPQGYSCCLPGSGPVRSKACRPGPHDNKAPDPDTAENPGSSSRSPSARFSEAVCIHLDRPAWRNGGVAITARIPWLAAETARAMLSLRSLAPSSTPGRICACISMIFFLSNSRKNLTCSHGLRIAFHIFHKILYHSIKINSRFFRLKQVLNVCLKQV